MKKCKGVYRIWDTPRLYIAWHNDIWMLGLKQYPNGPHAYVIGSLEISFPGWMVKP